VYLLRRWAIVVVIFLYVAASTHAGSPAEAGETGRSAPDFAPILRGEWTELDVAIGLPGVVRPLGGVKIRRLDAPRRFTVQAFAGAEAGPESRLADEKANDAVQEILKHHQAAVVEGISVESIEELRQTADAGKRAMGTLNLEVVAQDERVSSSIVTRDRFAAICEWVASMAELAITPRNPGTPPKDLEALLHGDWTELRVGVAVYPGGVAPQEHGVVITKTETVLSAQPFHRDDKGKKTLEPVEFPLTDREKIENQVLTHYRTAFREYAFVEKPLGVDVARILRSAAGKLETPTGGEPFLMMFVEAKTKKGPVTLSNFMSSDGVLRWVEQFGTAR
jgi:hypothetical protein